MGSPSCPQSYTLNAWRGCSDHDSSVFETTIRVVGGLLAAHDLSGDAMFARRCGPIPWSQFCPVVRALNCVDEGLPWHEAEMPRACGGSWTAAPSGR